MRRRSMRRPRVRCGDQRDDVPRHRRGQLALAEEDRAGAVPLEQPGLPGVAATRRTRGSIRRPRTGCRPPPATRRCACQPVRDADRGGHDAQREQLARAGPGDVPRRPWEQAPADDPHEGEQAADLGQRDADRQRGAARRARRRVRPARLPAAGVETGRGVQCGGQRSKNGASRAPFVRGVGRQLIASTRTSTSDRLSPDPRARWRALLMSISVASRGDSALMMAPISRAVR